MKSSVKFIYCLIACLAVAASADLNRLTDDGLGICWTQDVLRNWEDFGLVNLHGQLLTNPGGFAVETEPKIYPGHRPFGLYPAYFCHHFLGGALGVSIYYALLAALVLWSCWQLLGRTEAAFWLGAITVVTPGYLRWQTTLDPNLAAAIYGLPFCVIVTALLKKPVWRWPQLAGLAVLILVYSAINWSTALIHGMLCAFMLVMPGIPRRRLLIYVGLGALIAGAVVLYSVSNKLANAQGSSFSAMLAGYGWGNAGYGFNLSTPTAILRLVFVNTLGLLPVLIFLVWRSGWSVFSWRVISGYLPLLAAMGSVLILRNYFSHHPWMACHYLLLGLLLSAVALKPRLPARPKISPALGLTVFAVALVYGWVVLSFFHVHNGREIALVHFVREHTPRSATLVVASNADPELAGYMKRLEFDRHSLVVPALSDLEAIGSNDFVLTATPPPPAKLMVHWNNQTAADSWMKRVLAWYARVIAHRNPGDKVEVGNDYYLYQP